MKGRWGEHRRKQEKPQSALLVRHLKAGREVKRIRKRSGCRAAPKNPPGQADETTQSKEIKGILQGEEWISSRPPALLSHWLGAVGGDGGQSLNTVVDPEWQQLGGVC